MANNSVRIRIHSVSLCKSIVKLGVFPRKTGQEFVPNIPEGFLAPYVRGVFDGDGWVSLRRNSIVCGIVSTSQSYLIDLRFLLNGIGQIRTKLMRPDQTKTLYEWNMYSHHAERFRDFIYTGGFSLARKRDRFYSNYHKPNNYWTKEQISFLVKEYVPGGNLKVLSSKVGRSYKSVSKKIWELGLSAVTKELDK